MRSRTISTVLLDVDGTLVDSNDAHAAAWQRAFAEHGYDIPYDRIRYAVGMGGDKLMPHVSGLDEEADEGRRIAERRAAIFRSEFLPHVQPLRDSAALVAELRRRGFTLVAASSAKKDELTALLEIAGARGILDAATSSDDAEASKPDPDIIMAALRRAGTSAAQAVMIGDTPYDVAAARQADVASIGFLSGGWAASTLEGAVAIYEGPWDLLARLDESPLGGLLNEPQA